MKVGQGQLRAVESGGQIGGDDPVEAVAAGAGERRAVGDAGIEDDVIERAVGCARGGVGGFGRGAVGDVAGDGGAAGFARDGIERFAAPAEQRQLGAFGRKRCAPWRRRCRCRRR